MHIGDTVESLIPIAAAFVALSPDEDRVVHKAARILQEEIQARTLRQPEVVTSIPASDSMIFLGTGQSRILRESGLGNLQPTGDSPDAYRVVSKPSTDGVTVGIQGNSPRAVLFGAGRLLRRMRLSRDRWEIPSDLDIDAAPNYPLIGHQLGYRDKTNSYCAWDMAQFDRYIRELALFGTNAIELIPPGTDDLDGSVHFPLPHLEMLGEQSRICDEYGLDVWIWFPAMQDDYTDPAQIAKELEVWRETLSWLPRLDAIFVPGGDPGHTPAPVLLDLLAQLAPVVGSLHAKAKIWISPQGFAQEDLAYFLRYLAAEQPDWVGGAVHGPWVNIRMSDFRERVPARYPIRNYPDITHTLSSQFPVPEWDAALALTVGREPVNPRPVDAEHCFRFSQPGSIGMLSYSEGCNDDVNKFIWSGLSWNDQQDVFGILEDYARFFIDPGLTNEFAHGLYALEQNWRGPLAVNAGVQTTLRQFQTMEQAASPFLKRNWRFQQALYRAYYDAYTRERLTYETSLEVQALGRLRQAAHTGSHVAMRAALGLWDQAVLAPIAQDLRTRVFQLAEALFHSIRMQLSVDLYQAQYETRGANLDAIDYPLNDRQWWQQNLAETLKLATESERQTRIQELLQWRDATPGGFRDDLVRPHHKDRVQGWSDYASDPGSLEGPSRRFPYHKSPLPLPLSWRGGLVTLGTHSQRVRYTNLEAGATYALRVAYGGLSRTRVRLESAEGVLIHDWETPIQQAEFHCHDIPAEAIVDGTLNLIWHPEPTQGGSGAVCDISELILCKKSWLT